mmetsp:Transcript_167973/g.534228  ORF Transcript_167973/g.534228 Transcript_167973/m.534228 type:complete len:130 (-) Transcript_167973:639-1028(-)
MPFDRQVLRMKFVAEVPHYRMQFAPIRKNAGDLKGGSRPDVPNSVPIEWRLDQDEQAILMVTKPHDKGNLSRFDVMIRIQRKPAFYLWNVMFVLFFVTLSSAIAFEIDPQDIIIRAGLLLTLLLTTVGA